ncbi:conserved hypothetical protein [Anaeromyxobacter dehalogenans 2CP-1]|uniref:Uncharacterized protein n=1 Tax=Anaeromyxobacter dehalogenans (strain ATCC BAA-258 / DSM 21875 / 2CP-1) TaxID=455488 RepID=B8J5J0_ANAD2|nr:hypothetical protein [Anaeromyxobacter dehalogenans]ACL66852.1 conserved hypothetical protein [Anaeromyxobacter dehalogenans 2CP-1]
MARPVNPTVPRAAKADGWRRLMDLLGSLLILAVWLSLWAWVAVGVAAPLGRIGAGAPGPAASASLRARGA